MQRAAVDRLGASVTVHMVLCTMLRVTASTIEDYFRFDPKREEDLRQIDAVISTSAPELERWYVPGARGTNAGMKTNMIGYGHFFYTVKSCVKPIRWPIVGLALQKNYMSLYCSVHRSGRPFVTRYIEALGAVKVSPKGVVNFVRAESLNVDGLRQLLEDLEEGLKVGTLTARYGRVRS